MAKPIPPIGPPARVRQPHAAIPPAPPLPAPSLPQSPMPAPLKTVTGINRFQTSIGNREALLKWLRHLGTHLERVPEKQEVLKLLGPAAEIMIKTHFGTFSDYVSAAGFGGASQYTYDELSAMAQQFCGERVPPVTLFEVNQDLSMPPAVFFLEFAREHPHLLNPDTHAVPVDLSSVPVSLSDRIVSAAPLSAPDTHDGVIDFFATHGPDAPEMLLQWRRKELGVSLVSRVPMRLNIGYRWFGREKVFSGMDVSWGSIGTPKQFSPISSFRWNRVLKKYYPIKIYSHYGHEVIQAWLNAQGVPADHLVEKSYVNYLLWFEPSGGPGHASPYKMEILSDYFGRYHGIDRLVTAARAIDPRFSRHVSAVRLSFVTNPTRGEYHAVQLMPWDPSLSWEWDRLEARFLFEQIDGGWVLRRYSGMSSDEYAPLMMPDLKSRLYVVAGTGHVPISWPQLVETMAVAGLRRILFKTLWESDHPAEPFPKNFIFQASKRGKNERQAESMAILDADAVAGRRPSRSLAWLWFDRDEAEDMLQRAEGSNANELVTPYLAGRGWISAHSLETAVALRMYNDEANVKALTPNHVVGYFQQFGRRAVWKLVDVMRMVEHQPDKRPTKVTLSGQTQRHNGITVSGLRFREGGYQRSEKTNSTLFGVEWTLQPDGDYHVSQVVGSLGKRIAVASETKGGSAVFSPDADAKERVAQEVAKYAQTPEGFASIEPMSRPGPMITPAELKSVKPIENVPVKIENQMPGFAPSGVAWKELALKPSDTRFADHSPSPWRGEGRGEGGHAKLPESTAFEVLMIGLLSLIPALRLMRSTPMESFGSGSLFLNPSGPSSPNRI